MILKIEDLRKRKLTLLGLRKPVRSVCTLWILHILFSVFLACKPSSPKYDTKIFFDNIDSYDGLSLFTILNGYPVLKSFFTSLDPVDFNKALGDNLAKATREDNLGTLRASQSALLASRVHIQTLSWDFAGLIDKMENVNPGAYNAVQPLFEKIRTYPKRVVRNLVPISANALRQEYISKTNDQVTQSIFDFASDLKSADTLELLTEIEDVGYKALVANANVRSGVESILNGFFDPVLIADRSLKDGFISILYDSGEMMFKRAGFNDFKTPNTAMKELVFNLDKYFTLGGAQHNADYSDVQHPAELKSFLMESFLILRSLLNSGTLTVAPVNLLEKTAENLYLLGFAGSPKNVGASLKELVRIDVNGKDRAYDGTSRSMSALETLFVVLTIADNYGYTWDTANTSNDWILGATGGELTVGDAIHSLKSVMGSPDSFNFKNITNLSKNSGKVYRSNPQTSLMETHAFDLNSRVLSLLEDNARGITAPVSDPNAANFDRVYNKTLPWALHWVKRVTYGGYGPYYNKNRRDGAGNFLSPDGTITRNNDLSETLFQPTWQTRKYEIQLNLPAPNNTKYVGLRGNVQNAANVPNTHYTITEIPKTDEQRAVDSDEEAFYKNLQWLLYEKRFVAILPVRAKLSATVAFEEALFITAIGNGLVGMLNLKPNCNPNSCAQDNGRWSIDNSNYVKAYAAAGADLAYLSNIPGDSVMLLEGWGFGADGQQAFQVTFVYPALWSLIVPSPDLIYGMLPPVISLNVPVLERLGFSTSSKVIPEQVNSYWDKRNTLTPLVVALAKAMDDQVSAQQTPAFKNPYVLLTNLAELLSRPLVFFGPDSTATSPANPTPPNITQVRTIGMADGFRNPIASTIEYYPMTASGAQEYRTLVSVLSENTRRYQDGVLNLIGKTELLTGLVKFFGRLGEPANANVKSKVFGGIKLVLGEVRISAENPTGSQFNIEAKFATWRDEVANYPTLNGTNIFDPRWNGVDDVVELFRDYLSRNSGWSVVASLDFLFDLLLDLSPSPYEVKRLLDLVSSFFYNPDNTRSYTITNILTQSLPPVLEAMAPYGKSLYGTGYYLATSDGGFLSYLENRMCMNPAFNVKDLFSDTKNFLRSDIIQNRGENNHSFLFSAGILVRQIADVYQSGRKFSPVGFYMYDNWNTDQPASTLWDDMNFLFSVQ
ncbi:hypothetical protein EHQ12_00995 [Leptospira gomenensis]|uniref:Uncharacterized protein n=1 Tax=Leptospira gomenensis TaxID=2484974 RepID=A0A5F1Y7J1_9LEPT|nr:hypothetical protein [Leptospira gomenensis]TGK29036.1 hypothetical protein EHQ17_16920 [Leptospira gomenensis]TGK45003.1 hypothetical protein EHQ12_00995 [Leptospira gomenensis]TGK51861.1 hypothetical protein EHQ07_01610 [Leptospira gomenensis]TGK67331.1 hypothetical protein EHQ13_02460 [Leptospira gomenensis]